jgi:integrase
VDLARGIIRRVPRKTARRGKVVIIGLPEVLADHLRRLSRNGPCVMPDAAALYVRDHRALVLKVQRHLESCGIRTTQPGTGFEVVDGREVHTGQRAVVEAGFHSLRHSFVSLHAQAGTSQPILQQLVGHGSPVMTEIYTHLDADSARNTAATFPLVLTGAATTRREPMPSWALEKLATMNAENWKAIRDEITTEAAR